MTAASPRKGVAVEQVIAAEVKAEAAAVTMTTAVKACQCSKQ